MGDRSVVLNIIVRAIFLYQYWIAVFHSLGILLLESDFLHRTSKEESYNLRTFCEDMVWHAIGPPAIFTLN